MSERARLDAVELEQFRLRKLAIELERERFALLWEAWLAYARALAARHGLPSRFRVDLETGLIEPEEERRDG